MPSDVPDVIYIQGTPGDPEATHCVDRINDDDAAYARIPDNIEPDDAVVASRRTYQHAITVGNNLDAANARIAELEAARRTQDAKVGELVEAANRMKRCAYSLADAAEKVHDGKGMTKQIEDQDAATLAFERIEANIAAQLKEPQDAATETD